MELFTRGRQPSTATTRRSLSTSYLERRLSSLSVSRQTNESTEDIRGPLGLNLLWEPAEPRIEFVFVHGLRGGSRKTWSQSNDPAHYWPKEWLPLEPKFRNVRIHSYGYNADWGERKGSMLNVHDFGQALLADLHNSPYIKSDDDTPIILIGHSMGGLVIKKAYLLAKQDPSFRALSLRFHSLVFLATPHRGADSAQMLGNILRVTMSNPKAYVADLIPNSGTIQVINDEFRHVSHGVQIWSFFETVKTYVGIGQEMIVEKDSAVIGLPNERVQLLNADHRHVCKFPDPSDNNYVSIRNALSSAVDSIEREWFLQRGDERRTQLKTISKFLGISEGPEEDLLTVIEHQTEGTCQWLIEKTSFQDWQEGKKGSPQHLWLSGKPATGKSTVAGHVIKYLESCGSDCSYYFFKQIQKGNSSVSNFLCSIAFQMASVNVKVRQALLDMQDNGDVISKNDERTVWRILFHTRILRIELHQPHYWVMDALDECHNQNSLFTMLSKIEKSYPLRIFMTSRPSPVIERLFSQEKLSILAERVTLVESLRDIKLYLEAHSDHLPVENENELACTELIETILEKSNGCFLWADLVLKELESTHSEEKIWEVLKEVPTGMDELYTRILDGLSALCKDVELTKAIFRWTVCAARPLTLEELKEALRFDINATLPRQQRSIESICGNLIQVDTQSRVQVVHETVRAFLIKEGLQSDFAINRAKENSRLAEVCLNYLTGDEMKTPRNRRGSTGKLLKQRSPFVEYASFHFSGHIARSSSSTDRHFVLLEKFLNTNVLAWIESIARKGDLYTLTHTAKDLKVFLERRAKYRSPLGLAVHNVDSWANDLIHLVAGFGQALVASPTSIYSLVAPLCPLKSILYQTFGKSRPCLEVVGLAQTDWDDRISCITFPEDRVLSIACQDSRFVIGLSTGAVVVYYRSTLQEVRRLYHEEPVKQLEFASLNPYLASAGRRKIKLWDIKQGVQVWAAGHRNEILTMKFDETDTLLKAATRTNQLALWSVADGSELDTCPLHESLQEDQHNYRPPATHAQISTEMNLLAICHRQRPINIWDLTRDEFIGQFYVAGIKSYPGPLTVALVFNPDPDISLLAASYQEDYLVVFDPWTQAQLAITKTIAHALAASPDGKTLATGNGSGAIQLFDFETLRLLYRVTASDYNVNSIMFSETNFRFYDIRNDHCNIWEPPVLVRQHDIGGSQSESMSEEIASVPQVSGAHLWDDNLTITTMVDHHDGTALFCGREDGSIAVFDVRTGKEIQVLCKHAKNIAVSLLRWNERKHILVSADTSGRYVARKILHSSPDTWVSEEHLLDKRSAQAIQQVVISPDGEKLLLSLPTSDEVWSMAGQLVWSAGVLQPMSRIRITNPTNPNHLLLANGSAVHIYSWDTLSDLSPKDGIKLDIALGAEARFTGFLDCFNHGRVFVTFFKGKGTHTAPHLRVWAGSAFRPESTSAKPLADYNRLAGDVKAIIGIYKASLVFLDYKGWVCSLNVENAGTEEYLTKHFYIRHGWHSGAEPILRCTAQGQIVLARRDEIAVFHKGLEFEEKISLESGGVTVFNADSS